MVVRLKKKNYKKEQRYFNYFLTLYFGIGNFQSKRLLRFFGFSKFGSISKINYNDLIILENFLRKNFLLEYALKLEINNNVNQLINLKSYRGFRHKYKLPVNGQKSRVNSSTIKNYSLPKLEKRFIEDEFKLIKNYK